jgi:uncharacterized protein (DUF427 family)
MAMRMGDMLMKSFAELRYEPTSKRVRGLLGGETVLDSARAVLVWEANRLVPFYAVPRDDLHVELVAAQPEQPEQAASADDPQHAAPAAPRLPAGPGTFVWHTSAGEELSIRHAGATRPRTAFSFADPDLVGYIGLDFYAFDMWLEEEDEIVAHPRDPFHRIDVRRSSRHIRIEVEGCVVADSTQPRLLFETHLPVRFYIPAEDVSMDLLRPSPKRTSCAYKGWASYVSLVLGERTVPDIAWTYEQPLPEASDVAGMVAFFDERVDVLLDGQRRARPRTPWSPPES